VPGHPIIEVRLDAHQNNRNMCAIAMLENNQGALKLTKLSEYFQGHKELDNHYKWGMRWTAGSK
jgi:tellurite resistance protein TerA